MRILLAGGGSGGSTTPVLAVAEELRAREPTVALLYVGTSYGPEGRLARTERIPYASISAGKLRRYWSVENALDGFRVLLGVIQSLRLIRRFRPDVALGAGGFASVPPLLATALLRVPILIHQQDVVPGLANRLLVPFASRITVSMPQTLGAFPKGKTVLRGNPVRARVLAGEAQHARVRLSLEEGVPLVLVTGGGTGALRLNEIVAEAAPDLARFCQVLHLSGRGRGVPAPPLGSRYQQHEFLVDEMPHALAAAGLVITRAGMATLSELAALAKPAVVVPMPASHQEANAAAFAEKGAALVLDERTLTPSKLVATTRLLLDSPERSQALARAIGEIMPRDAAARLAHDLTELAR